MSTIEKLYRVYQEYPEIVTDSRKITKGCLFFALRGSHFDGNAFAEEAINRGAKYAVVDDPALNSHSQFILVEDVLKALQDLAVEHRRTFDIPFIALTGSNGKTTTKELLREVLSKRYLVHATQGNLNNHIGVPLTLLEMKRDTEVAIIEMGANHIGEIAFLCGLAQPTHGLITNVGKAHLEGFGSFEGVQKGKGELYRYLSENEGKIFIQGDNTHLRQMLHGTSQYVVASYGVQKENNTSGTLKSAVPFLEIIWEDENLLLKTQITGAYNFDNVLAAVCVGAFFEVNPEQIKEAIENYKPVNQRSQIIKTDQNTLIADYYNANPSSMMAALDNLDKISSEGKAVILGDMYELGAESREEHRMILTRAQQMGLKRLILVGEIFKSIGEEEAECYKNTEEAKQALGKYPLKDNTVLVKGSRGIALENLVDVL